MASSAAPLHAIFRFKNEAPTTTQHDSLCRTLAQVVHTAMAGIVQAGRRDADNTNGNDGTHGKAAQAVQHRHVRARLHVDPLLHDRSSTPLGQFSARDRAFLHDALPQLAPPVHDRTPVRGDVWTERWFPQYAAALQIECVSVGTLSFRVLALDGWERTLHFPAPGTCVHSAVPTTHAVIHCGRIDVALYAQVLTCLDAKLAEASQRTGSSRSAAANKETAGHQKTPPFLAAMVRNAIDAAPTAGEAEHSEQENDRHLPLGGMTDVGKHTGGEARDTCWALVAAVLRQALPGNAELFQRVEIALFARFLTDELASVRQVISSAGTNVPQPSAVLGPLDRCFQILDAIAVRMLELGERGFDGAEMEEKCRQWRLDVDSLAQAWNDHRAGCYRMPHAESMRAMRSASSSWPLEAPAMVGFASSSSDTTNVRDRVLSTIQHYEFVGPHAASTATILGEIKAADRAITTYQRIATLRAIEAFLYRATVALSTGKRANTLTCYGYYLVVDWFRTNMAVLTQQPNYDEIARVKLQSKYLLLSHVVFCLTHQRSCAEFPILKQYKIALDWQRLEVCVLDEAASRTALLEVARYIRTFNSQCSGPTVFDLSNHDGTRHFARQIAPTLPAITASYEVITRTWEAHVDVTWSNIQQRKTEVAEHRAQVKVFQEQVRDYQARLDAEIERLEALRDESDDEAAQTWDSRYHRYGPPPVSSDLTHEYKIQLRYIKNAIGGKRARIKQLVTLPEFLVSPLAIDPLDAKEVLFYLDTPYNIGVIAELCGRAQKALGPIADSLKTTVHVSPKCATSWSAYFSSRKGAAAFKPKPQFLTAFPGELEPPTSFGKDTIDRVSSRQSFVNTCAWYPQVDGTQLLWKGSTDTFENPFLIKSDISRAQFTAKVPTVDGDASNYQWINTYPGGLDRSNIPYAKADVAGEAVRDFRGFLTLGSIRAAPLQQIRKVFAAVQDDAVDWSKPLVATVVRQALFHVGELTDADRPQYLWHSDLAKWEYMSTMVKSLQQLLTRIGASPRRWNSVPLLADIAGFLPVRAFAFMTPLRSELARITRAWSAEVRSEWKAGVPPVEQAELRGRECLLYGYAILCFRLGSQLTPAECKTVCELVVLFHNSQLFANGSSLQEQIRAVESSVQDVMADRVVELVEYVTSDPVGVLTPVCQAVNMLIPSDMAWTPVAVSADAVDALSSCFEATHADTGVHYLVNLFTGSVLTDGAPPGGLPKEVRAMPTYKQLFGDQDFEVSGSKHGVYASVQPFHGYLYRFRVLEQELIVEESHVVEYPSSSGGLQLCRQAWVTQFATHFPTRLVELYSHWYWHHEQCVLLRPRVATKKEVAFVVKFTDSKRAQCFQVPRADQSLSPTEILKRIVPHGYRCFIAPDENLKKALWKFEDTSFTHFLRAPLPLTSVEIELPRYGLRFVQTRDGSKLTSVEFSGYVLSHNQQLNDQFCRFRRYLVLDNASGDDTNPKRKLLVPAGCLSEYVGGTVDVTRPKQSSATIATNVFDVHNRLGVLTAETIESRLQLASLHTTSANLVPWPALQMTGGEAAMEILRGCWPTRPYSPEAATHLETIKQYGSRHTPALAPLVSLLLTKAQRLRFLFDASQEQQPTTTQSGVHDDTSCLDELDDMASVARSRMPENTLRRGLTVSEEWDLFGPYSTHHSAPETYRHSTHVPIEVGASPVDDGFVEKEEEKLRQLLGSTNATASQRAAQFPLSERGSNKTSTGMMAELRNSWRVHHEHPDGVLRGSLTDVKAAVRSSHERVVGKRELVFSFLQDCVSRGRAAWMERLLTRVNRVPTLTIADIVRSVLDEEVLLRFTPTLSASSRRQFKKAALVFMELCVLEDKLERILSRATATPPPPVEYFVEELACVRRWKTSEHPYWLVFEVEGQLQIRPEQYIIARHLIDNPGSISQLNMGRGKTRVILPMLFLYYRYNATNRVVRSHFLSPLLSETRQFMHRVLSSGVLRLPFVELPFNRSVEVGEREVLLMQEAVEEVKQNGGFLIMAPEHRLSLELKRQELQNSDVDHREKICHALDTLMEPTQYIDIFDESDALLHHKYHLVYAVGTPEILDGGSARWLGAQALLRVLMSPTSTRTADVLKRSPDLYCLQLEYRDRCGAYTGFRLNTAIEATKASRVALKKALLEDLIDQAPFEMAWLKAFASRDQATRALLIQAICDGSVDADSVLKLMPSGIEGAKLQLLALRGLLAYGVLESCLEKRNRVTYGLPDPGTRGKSLAIPFTAADLPAERSEFSHPDVSIVLTLLAYYHSGLTDKDIHKAFDVLLRLDYSERNRYYEEWYQPIETKVDTRHRVMLSKLDHLSLDNAFQFSIVCDAYRHSMELINFFLNRLVFPRDTKQYPERLSRSAWDLVRGPQNVGFSGTNDTHRLLPVAVTQHEPDTPSLRGTNGKMIDLLLTATIGYVLLEDQTRATQSTGQAAMERPAKFMWQLLLLKALEKHCVALIDTGALLAGVAIDAAAQFLIQEATFNAAGVTYYDTRKEYDCWVVLERERQVLRPLKTSSLHERDTFVIFDEARARGSDMKLHADAIALLTLGPNITKDKLMQGAGRMRQLGRNQKLWLTSTVEVKNSVLQLASTSSSQGKGSSDGGLQLVDGLNWVMENTQQQCTLGLLEWAQNGIQFCAKEIDPLNELQDEDWTLESQYNSAQTDELIYDIVVQRVDLLLERNDEQISAQSSGQQDQIDRIFDQIDDRAFTYGYEDEVHVSSYGEECERELQVEEEEEVFTEERAPAMTPAREVAWDVSSIFKAQSASQVVAQGVTMTNLCDAARQGMHPPSCASTIAWALAKLYATSNFWTTVTPPGFGGSFNQRPRWTGYLRMFDVLVIFKDGTVLALTDLEADALLRAIAGADAATPRHFYVVHLTFACHLLALQGTAAILRLVPMSVAATLTSERTQVPMAAIVACCLLNGDTQFDSMKQEAITRHHLQQLLQRLKLREMNLQIFIETRRFPQRWTRSLLHLVTKEMDLLDLH